MTSWKSNGVFWCGGGGSVVLANNNSRFFCYVSSGHMYNEGELRETMIEVVSSKKMS